MTAMAQLLEQVRKQFIILRLSDISTTLGPNELSICEVNTVQSILGVDGLAKGPSKSIHF